MGKGLSRGDILAERDRQTRVQLFTTAPPEELSEIFRLPLIVALGTYQLRLFSMSRSVDSFMRRPLTNAFTRNYPDQTNLLTHNNAMYDDRTEDWLDTDPIVAALRERSKAQPDRTDIRDAMRARRTTLALIDYASRVAETPPQPEDAPLPTAAPLETAA
jgi:hypothetical protein